MPKRSAGNSPSDEAPSPKRSPRQTRKTQSPTEDDGTIQVNGNNNRRSSTPKPNNTGTTQRKPLSRTLFLSDDEDDIVVPKAEGLDTEAIRKLQSPEYRKVLDIISRLRVSGLSSIFPLPQIVVCGDQSSGKSSVLEALTEVPFPHHEDLCTRFVTQIVMRSSYSQSIKVRIIPDSERSKPMKAQLEAFGGEISDFKKFPQLVADATKAMGLKPVSSAKRATQAFTRDVLSVEISGPNRPQLTLVDTPGIIQSSTKTATEEDVVIIQKLVDDYIKQERTIILAVVSAKNDPANQTILQKARTYDPKGQRTLGIITKPDCLPVDSPDEKLWLDVARNKNVEFALGWHLLKNLPNNHSGLFEARNASEAAFFKQGAYQDLPPMSMGIENLRQRLSVILFDHIKKELPKVEVEIIKEHQSVVDSLTHLGGSRSTQSERREFLLKVAETFRNLVQRADNGSYKHDFFGKGDKERQLATGDNIKRLRASVVYLNDQFASQMRQFGHKFRIEETDKTIGTNPSDESHEPRLNDDYKKAHHLQKPMEYKAAIEWAEGQLVIDRGHELSGHSNAELVGTLFQTQSEHWAELSKAHLSRMATLCESFTQAAIHYAVGSADDVATKLLRRHLVPKLQQRHEAAEFELQQLLLDLADMPQTSNQEFSKQCREALAKEIQGNLRQDLSGASVELTSGKNGEQGKSVISSAMLALKWVSGNLNRNPDKLTAENALVALLVYYKMRCDYHIQNIITQAVERHMLRGLADDLLPSALVNRCSEEDIAEIAAEPEHITQERVRLEERRAKLEQGKKEFHDHSL